MDWLGVIFASLGCLLVIVSAAPQGGASIKIITQSSEVEADGGYKWSYDTENGIKAEETGTLKKATGPDQEDTVVVQGGYSYTDLDGNKTSITYVADDVGGFQPVGSHLPTPPPIPDYILRALEWIRAHPEPESKQNR